MGFLEMLLQKISNKRKQEKGKKEENKGRKEERKKD